MSKKSFAAAPRPRLAPEAIDAYVQAGAGHDTGNVPPQKAQEKPRDIPLKRLSLDLPEDMHRRFKVACAATGRKMAAELTAFVEQRTVELEDETHI